MMQDAISPEPRLRRRYVLKQEGEVESWGRTIMRLGCEITVARKFIATYIAPGEAVPTIASCQSNLNDKE
jgi:hypothetical protein